MIHIGFAPRARSAPTSAWCPNSSTRARRNARDASRGTAIGWCGRFWWKWRGARCAIIRGPGKLFKASVPVEVTEEDRGGGGGQKVVSQVLGHAAPSD